MLLNERSGKIYNIPDYPVISPDGKRIISACYCPPFALGYCKNEILVFQFAGHSNELKKEFHLTPDDYGAGDTVWISNSEISLGYYFFRSKTSEIPEKAVNLRSVKGKWYLKKPKTPKKQV